MNSKPCALVISVASQKPEDIIKLILDVEELPNPSTLEENIQAYPWHVDTKYYTAEVNLCSMENKTIGSREFAEGVGAAVINFDSEKVGGMEAVESWLPFIKEISPDVLILLCDHCPEVSPEGINRVDVQKWCVENKFELVELNPEPDSGAEEEDLSGLAVTTGVRRVVQALHAHLWPNMIMKDRSQHISPAMHALLNEVNEASQVSSLSENFSNIALTSQERGDLILGDNDENLDSLLHDIEGVLCDTEESDPVDPELEAGIEFGSLLSRLNQVKSQVATMPNEQRKVYAEQVVMAFWRAIGGDEEELEGLDICDDKT